MEPTRRELLAGVGGLAATTAMESSSTWARTGASELSMPMAQMRRSTGWLENGRVVTANVPPPRHFPPVPPETRGEGGKRARLGRAA